MFYDILQNLCEKNNIKLTPVLKKLGMSEGSMTSWKNGGVIPNGETLIKLADYFNVPVDYLLGRDNYVSDLQSDETKIIKNYRTLSERRKGKAEILIQQLADEQQNEDAPRNDEM